MPERVRSDSVKAGLPPGSLVHVGEVVDVEPRITLVDYTTDSIEQQAVQSVEQILDFRNTRSVTWVNVEGLKDITLIEAIGMHFDIHPLVLEDILNTRQRPKLEEYEDYLYIVLKGTALRPDRRSVEYEQISVLLLYFRRRRWI